MNYNSYMVLRRNFYKLILIAFFSFLPLFSSAQEAGEIDTGGCNPAKQICNPISAGTIQEVIKTFLEGALKIGIPIIVLAIIYCGFLFVAARGNAEKITQAKDALLYTIIGAVILLGAWAIAMLITETVKGLGT